MKKRSCGPQQNNRVIKERLRKIRMELLNGDGDKVRQNEKEETLIPKPNDAEDEDDQLVIKPPTAVDNVNKRKKRGNEVQKSVEQNRTSQSAEVQKTEKMKKLRKGEGSRSVVEPYDVGLEFRSWADVKEGKTFRPSPKLSGVPSSLDIFDFINETRENAEKLLEVPTSKYASTSAGSSLCYCFNINSVDRKINPCLLIHRQTHLDRMGELIRPHALRIIEGSRDLDEAVDASEIKTRSWFSERNAFLAPKQEEPIMPFNAMLHDHNIGRVNSDLTNLDCSGVLTRRLDSRRLTPVPSPTTLTPVRFKVSETQTSTDPMMSPDSCDTTERVEKKPEEPVASGSAGTVQKCDSRITDYATILGSSTSSFAALKKYRTRSASPKKQKTSPKVVKGKAKKRKACQYSSSSSDDSSSSSFDSPSESSNAREKRIKLKIKLMEKRIVILKTKLMKEKAKNNKKTRKNEKRQNVIGRTALKKEEKSNEEDPALQLLEKDAPSARITELQNHEEEPVHRPSQWRQCHLKSPLSGSFGKNLGLSSSSYLKSGLEEDSLRCYPTGIASTKLIKSLRPSLGAALELESSPADDSEIVFDYKLANQPAQVPSTEMQPAATQSSLGLLDSQSDVVYSVSSSGEDREIMEKALPPPRQPFDVPSSAMFHNSLASESPSSTSSSPSVTETDLQRFVGIPLRYLSKDSFGSPTLTALPTPSLQQQLSHFVSISPIGQPQEGVVQQGGATGGYATMMDPITADTNPNDYGNSYFPSTSNYSETDHWQNYLKQQLYPSYYPYYLYLGQPMKTRPEPSNLLIPPSPPLLNNHQGPWNLANSPAYHQDAINEISHSTSNDENLNMDVNFDNCSWPSASGSDQMTNHEVLETVPTELAQLLDSTKPPRQYQTPLLNASVLVKEQKALPHPKASSPEPPALTTSAFRMEEPEPEDLPNPESPHGHTSLDDCDAFYFF